MEGREICSVHCKGGAAKLLGKYVDPNSNTGTV